MLPRSDASPTDGDSREGQMNDMGSLLAAMVDSSDDAIAPLPDDD